MCYGNEVSIKSTSGACLEVFFNFAFQRFTQYLASSNSNFQLNGFLDKTGVQGLLTKMKFEKTCTFNMNHLDSTARFNAKITSDVSHSPEVKFLLMTRLDMSLFNYWDKRNAFSMAQGSFLEGYYQDKIQSAIAQAVYLDPGMKHSHEQAKSLGKC